MDKGLARTELRSYLLDFLSRSLPDDRFRHPVQEMLSVPGFILSDNPRSLVPIGALLCYEAASQRPWSDAVPAAASLELAFYASEFVDKGLDQEALRPSEQWEVLKGVNAGYCLQLLAARALLDLLDRGFSWQQVRQAQISLAEIVAEGSTAQHLDLDFEDKPETTLDEALDMTILKGGTLVSGLGRLGASLGTDEPVLVETITTFGWHMGTYRQLVNDLTDAGPGNEHKSDIRRRKKTSPIVYLIHHPEADAFQKERGWLRGDQPISEEMESVIRAAIVESGAQDYGAVLADTYRTRAIESLEPLSSRLETGALADALLGVAA